MQYTWRVSCRKWLFRVTTTRASHGQLTSSHGRQAISHKPSHISRQTLPLPMTCHHGHTLQNTVFGLLHLATHFGLAGWHHAPLSVPTTCFVAGAIYHAGMAVVCESASVSEAVHWEADAFVRLRMAHMTCSLAASLVWLASSSITRGKDSYKAATNEAMTLGLIGLVLANICSLCWAFSTAGSVEHILPAYGVTSVLAFWLSLVSILAKNSTTTMKGSTSLFGGLMSTAALVQYFYNLDLNGRVIPHTAEDAAHPHLSVLLHFGLKRGS